MKTVDPVCNKYSLMNFKPSEPDEPTKPTKPRELTFTTVKELLDALDTGNFDGYYESVGGKKSGVSGYEIRKRARQIPFPLVTFANFPIADCKSFKEVENKVWKKVAEISNLLPDYDLIRPSESLFSRYSALVPYLVYWSKDLGKIVRDPKTVKIFSDYLKAYKSDDLLHRGDGKKIINYRQLNEKDDSLRLDNQKACSRSSKSCSSNIESPKIEEYGDYQIQFGNTSCSCVLADPHFSDYEAFADANDLSTETRRKILIVSSFDDLDEKNQKEELEKDQNSKEKNKNKKKKKKK